MIRNTSRFYGTAIISLIDSCEDGYTIKKLFRENPGIYLVNSKLPIMLKHATKRTSPWPFTLRAQHLQVYSDLALQYGECLLLFVCGNDGIATLASREVKDILQFNDGKEQKRISIARKLNEMYNITASDGKMNKRISQNSLLDNLKNFFGTSKGPL